MANQASESPELPCDTLHGSYQATRLIASLEARRARIAFDQDDIRGGEDWRRKLKNLVERAQNVVFLISSASLGSQVCRWE